MPRRRRAVLWLSLAASAAVVANAHANAVWALPDYMWRLIDGVPFIPALGVLKGAVAALVVRARAWRMLAMMAVASIWSAAWLVAVASVVADRLAVRMLQGSRVEAGEAYVRVLGCGLLGACTIAAVLLEWPFCHAGTPRPRRAWRRSLAGCAVAQLVGLAVVGPWLATSTAVRGSVSLYRWFHADRLALRDAGPVATVYFVDADGRICCIQLDGTGLTALSPTGTVGRSEPYPLFLDAGPDGVRTDLCLRRGTDGWTLAHGVSSQAGAEYPAPAGESAQDPTDLQPPHARAWTVGRPGPKAFVLRGALGQVDRRISLYVPGLLLSPRSVTLLPGELVVLEYRPVIANGRPPEVVLLDVRRGRLARLAAGRCPVVVLNRYRSPGATELRLPPR